MPETIVDLGKKAKAKYPGAYDDIDDAELGRKIKTKFPGQYDDFTDTPPQGSQTQTWAQKLGLTDPRAAGMVDFAEGIASGAASGVFHGGDLIRRMTGQPRVINEPDVQQAMREPPSLMGRIGKFGEQVAETVIPGMGLTKGLRGASLLTRIGAEAALGGTQA